MNQVAYRNINLDVPGWLSMENTEFISCVFISKRSRDEIVSLFDVSCRFRFCYFIPPDGFDDKWSDRVKKLKEYA